MESGKIVKQFTKFIYPFKYEKNSPQKRLDEIIFSSKGNAMRVWERCGVDGHEIREDISEFFSDTDEECPSRIADCYSLNLNCRSTLGLPKNRGDVLTFVCRNDNRQKVSITDVRLYLFESEVGFAEITCGYQSQGIADYIDCNYFISEIKSDKNYFVFTKRDADAQESEIRFSVKELLQRMMAYAGEVQQFNNKGKDFSEIKPIVYSYLLLDEKPDNLETLLFLVRKNYTESYKLPKSEYDIYNNPNVLQNFDNSYWATSKNSVVNVTFLVGDKKTDDFFTNNFSPRMLTTYYHLFLSVLHQKYAVQHFLVKMGRLDKIVEKYSVMNTQLKCAREYRAQAASLKFRAFFKIPSNIEHINNYFNLISNTYEIDTICDNFNADIDNLVSICDTYVSRINDHENMKRNIKREKIQALVVFIGGLVVFVTLFNTSWEILEKVCNETLPFFSPQVLVLFVVLLLSITVTILDVFGRLTGAKRSLKNLKDEFEDRPKLS